MKELEEFNINEQIAELINHHGFKTQLQNETIRPNFKEKVEIETWIYPQQYDNYFITRFDIGVQFDNGTELFESFGDIGSTIEECVAKNMNSFSLCSLHPLLDAFNDTDKHSEVESWTLNGANYKAYIGNYHLKMIDDTQTIEIPNNLLNQIESYLNEYTWDEKFYFIRLFFADDGYNKTIEFMVNNVNLSKEEELLKQLNWQETNDYYSIRMFIVLKREG